MRDSANRRPGVILRFRDLITEQGGTIRQHKKIVSIEGCVWWGWWARQTEEWPYDWFVRLGTYVERGSAADAWLFDSGRLTLYFAPLLGIAVSPDTNGIRCPDPTQCPGYYDSGSFPAWFKLGEIVEVGDSLPPNIVFTRRAARPTSLRALGREDPTVWPVTREVRD